MNKLQPLDLLPTLDKLASDRPPDDPMRQLLHVYIGFPPFGVAETEMEEVRYYCDNPDQDTSGAPWKMVEYADIWRARGIDAPMIRLISGNKDEGSGAVRHLAALKGHLPVWVGLWPTYQNLLAVENKLHIISESGTGADLSTRTDFWVSDPDDHFMTIQREVGQTNGNDLTHYEPGDAIDPAWRDRAAFWREELRWAKRVNRRRQQNAADLGRLVALRTARLVPMENWELLYDHSPDAA